MDTADLLTDLDEAQVGAVTTASTLVAVIAGAGSGKTRVLTRRVAYRIAMGTASAEHSLVLTFTRQAAGELRRRLPHLGVHNHVNAGTFHSVCRGILQRYWSDNDQRPPTLRHDRNRLIATLVDREHLGEVLAAINVAASRGWSDAEFAAAVRSGRHRTSADLDTVTATMRRYRDVKQQRHIIDLDDLIAQTVGLLERDQQFASALRWRYRHVYVDEAQDLNPLQQRLLDLIRFGHDDVYVVGDPAQSIYGFNGADVALLTDVSKHFGGVEIFRLPVNHRSTPQIVQAGSFVLNAAGQHVDVVSARDDAALVEVVGAADERGEAEDVVEAITVMDPAEVRSGKVAVLARTHDALRTVGALLSERGVPVRFQADGDGSAFTPHLRQLYRLATVDQLRAWVQDQAEMLTEADDQVLRLIVDAVLAFLRERPAAAGAEFEQWVEATHPFGQRTNGVELLTFHAAKGREWHTVHLIGVESGLVPHRSATTKAAKAEEARLLYVAITRATDQLVVHWAARRNGYQRSVSPLLRKFHSTRPDAQPPPPELTDRARSERARDHDALLAWRARTARASGILPTQLLTDGQLGLLLDCRPRSPRDLDALLGIGAMTAEVLFEGIATAFERAAGTDVAASPNDGTNASREGA